MLTEILHRLKRALRQTTSVFKRSILENLSQRLKKKRTSIANMDSRTKASGSSSENEMEYGRRTVRSLEVPPVTGTNTPVGPRISLTPCQSPILDVQTTVGKPGWTTYDPKKVSVISRSESTAVYLTQEVDFDTQTIRINVGGHVFVVTRDSLNRYPTTLLGSLTPSHPAYIRSKREYFFDRNPSLFNSILDLYRVNALHLPRNICGKSALRELEFWNIPTVWVSACCWSSLHEAIHEERLLRDLREGVSDTGRGFRINWARAWLWDLLYDRRFNPVCSKAWNILVAVLLMVSILLFFVDSWTEISPRVYFRKYLAAGASPPNPLPRRRNYTVWVADMLILTILMVEFAFKVALCPSLRKFCRNMLNVLYGLSLLGSFAAHIAESYMESKYNWEKEDSLETIYIFSRCVRWLRILRLLELLDWNASLYVMWVATMNCQRELLLLFFVFVIQALIFGAITFFAENNSDEPAWYNPKTGKRRFTSDLAESLYWAVITMTTVGYGDITPTTNVGRLVGALCSLSGVMVLALPVAILTDSFQQYQLRQKIRQEQRKREIDFLHTVEIHLNSIGVQESVSG